uniref:Transposase n=1 Tax=Chryseobacterium endophyticum TaxID=1854762 RepID=A0AAU6WRC6_9FLAO
MAWILNARQIGQTNTRTVKKAFRSMRKTLKSISLATTVKSILTVICFREPIPWNNNNERKPTVGFLSL